MFSLLFLIFVHTAAPFSDMKSPPHQTQQQTRNIFKKNNRRKLSGWLFDNLQSTVDTFSEALYFLHVEVMANLDHHKSLSSQ